MLTEEEEEGALVLDPNQVTFSHAYLADVVEVNEKDWRSTVLDF